MHSHGPASKTKYDYAKKLVIASYYKAQNKTRAENL